MEAGSILFGLAMVILVGAYLAGPLSVPSQRRIGGADGELSTLISERERLLDAILELDADLGLGKLGDESYQQQRRALALQGAQVLRRLDELQGTTDLESDLEAAIAELRQQQSGFCPQCGQGIYVSDRFCGNCGADLKERGG